MRNVLMLCSALTLLYVAQAQDKGEHFLQSPNTAWAFGARFGVNMSSVAGDMPPGYSADGKGGAYLGFVFNKAIGKGWAIQPAFYYSPQGYMKSWSSGSTTYDERRLMGYLNLPVQIQYNTPVGFTVQTGPQVGLLFVNDYDNNSSGSTLDWTAGVSYISRSGFGLEVGYILGLTSFASEHGYSGPPQPSPTSYELKHRVFQAGVVYYFAVAKKRPARS